MKPIFNLLCTINNKAHQQYGRSATMVRRWIHSGLAMTSQEVATALRPFIFTVHPDRFWNYPKEKNTNEISLKRLNEFIGDKSDGKHMNNREETITFYIRNSSTTNNEQNKFEKVDIKLNSKENISTTVHRILSQCSLPTDYLNKISKETKPNYNQSKDNRQFYRYENEFFYSKDLFHEMEAQFFRTKMEVTFQKWIKTNCPIALKKFEASLPIRMELSKIKQELISELNLIDLNWNCDWTVSHIRGALKNLMTLYKQYPEDMKKLHSKMILFTRHNGVSFEGQVCLNIGDVRNNWLYCIRSIKNYDFYVKNLPLYEKEISELFGGISIIRPDHNLWNVKKYYTQLEKMTRSIHQYEINQGFPIYCSDSLVEHRLMIELDSGPLVLLPNGDFVAPVSCPIGVLIRFINENLNQASRMLEKDEFNLEHERILIKECIDTFRLSTLEKDINITPEQMIEFCRRLLDNGDKYKNDLNDAHIKVSMYYTVMHDGQIHVPFNFIV